MKPRDYQLKVVDIAKKHSRAGFEMVTGSGKTFTMALLMNALQLRTLIIVPTLELKNQLHSVFLSLFGDTRWFTVENIDSPRLKTDTKYDVLILDECHRAASATYRKLNKIAWTGIYYRYFFTGTFFRNDKEERLLLESITGKCKFKFGYKDAIEAKAIVPVEAYYIELPKIPVKGTTYAQVYSELVVNRADRNNIIANLLNKLHSQDISTLCLVREVAHGDKLKTLSGAAFIHGNDPDRTKILKWFNSKKLHTLIATTGVAGEGVDTKPAEYIIIAGLGKSSVQFQQQIGRGIRTYPGKQSCKIILFKDVSHKFTKNHFNEQLKILRDVYGVVPIKLDL